MLPCALFAQERTMGTEVHLCQPGTFGTRNQTELRMSQTVAWCILGGGDFH